jgi:hypothetical protein
MAYQPYRVGKHSGSRSSCRASTIPATCIHVEECLAVSFAESGAMQRFTPAAPRAGDGQTGQPQGQQACPERESSGGRSQAFASPLAVTLLPRMRARNEARKRTAQTRIADLCRNLPGYCRPLPDLASAACQPHSLGCERSDSRGGPDS